MANRLPWVGVSVMDCLTQGFNFIVTLNEFMYGFQSISGFSIKKNTGYIEEGGVNDHIVMVGEPQNDRSTLMFKRGLMVHSTALASNSLRAAAARIPNNLGRKAALLAASSLDPQEALETGPAVGLIQVYSRQNELRALYSFLSLGMIEWSMDDLDASDSKILIESFTVAHTGLVRLPMALPSIVGAIKNAVTDSETKKNADLAESIQKANEERSKKSMEANEASVKFLEEERNKIRMQLNSLAKEKEKNEKDLEEEKENKESLEAELAQERAKEAEERHKETELRFAQAEEAKQGKTDTNQNLNQSVAEPE